MMRSKSFETQEVREIVQKVSHLMDVNNRSCLPEERKEM